LVPFQRNSIVVDYMLGRASPLRNKHEFEIVEFNMSSYGIHCRFSVFISYRSISNDGNHTT